MPIIASKKYYINSEQRLEGTTNSFAFGMQVPANKFDSVVVLQASIPMSFYTVEDGFNTFILTELGVDTIITVPPANYNVTSYPIVVKALLNSNSPNGWVYDMVFPISYTSGNTGKFTYTVTGNSGQPSMTFTNEMHEEFKIKVRGYDPVEVDEFLDAICDEIKKV